MATEPIILCNEFASCWITVGRISVRVGHTGNGAVCNMYVLDDEDNDDAHLASCYSLFSQTTVTQQKDYFDNRD
jgi:hypothetical protein